MKDINTYRASGVLELFVTGNLSEAESAEVASAIEEHPELLQEVGKIEVALQHLARAAAPYTPNSFEKVIALIRGGGKVIPLSRKSSPVAPYLGWAASALLLFGVGYFYVENETLEEQLTDVQMEKTLQEAKTLVVEEDLANTRSLLDVVRDRDLVKVPLGAQAIAPEAFAAIYWDKETNKVYADVSGLPEPPEGKVYQLWSLTLEPLTPTSIGVLDQYDSDSNQIFELPNPNESQAFGITLEPAGGSESPTLEQLYTLGVVATS